MPLELQLTLQSHGMKVCLHVALTRDYSSGEKG